MESMDQDLLDTQGHPSGISVRKNQSWDVWKERRSPKFWSGFSLEGQTEWSCWSLARTFGFRAGSSSLAPSPGAEDIPEGQFGDIQRSESTWDDSSSPVGFSCGNTAPKATGNRNFGGGGFVCPGFIHCSLQILQE